MKYLFPILSVFLLSLACTSDNTEPPDDEYPSYDEYGIVKWDEGGFTFTRYYTLVGTLTPSSPIIEIVIRIDDDVETGVVWEIDGLQITENNMHDEWISNLQKWVRTYPLILPQGFVWSDGQQVKATVTIGDKTVTRQERITEIKKERQLIGVNFGMSRQEVEDNILGSAYTGLDDEYYIENRVWNFNSDNAVTLYTFEAGELVEVGEYMLSNGLRNDDRAAYEIPASFIGFCREMGLAEEMIINDDGYLEKEYEWTKGELIFHVHNRELISEFDIFSDTEVHSENAVGISYRYYDSELVEQPGELL